LTVFVRGKKYLSGLLKAIWKRKLVDEVNKLSSESFVKVYSRRVELNILLGEPLPNKDQKIVDFDKDSDFEMLFDIAVAIEIER